MKEVRSKGSIFSVINPYPEGVKINVNENVDLNSFAKDLFETGATNARVFSKIVFPGGKYIFHLIRHHEIQAEKHPTVRQMTDFGATLGYQETNLRDLLFFYEACKKINDQKVIDLLNRTEVVASQEGSFVGNGQIPVAPMIKGLENFNIHSLKGTCPRFILVLVKEEVK